MKPEIKISKHTISVKSPDIDLRQYEEEIADFVSGLKANIILASEEFVPWEKVKRNLPRKAKGKK